MPRTIASCGKTAAHLLSGQRRAVQAEAMSVFPCSKSVGENLREIRGGNAATGVDDGDRDASRFVARDMHRNATDVGGEALHRVFCVSQEVDKNLQDFVAIHIHGP